MSYPPPQGGYPPYGGQSPQPGYQQPPPGQYPPQQQQGYGPPPGQPQGYGQQPQGYPPQGPPPPHGYPPQGQYNQHQGYPPQQAPYSAPPHSPYPPQQQPYGAPPPPHGHYPQQQHQQQPYGAPPQGQYPPQQHQQQQPYGAPPQAPYGAPPPQPYGAPQSMPTLPSPGYDPNRVVQFDATGAADQLRKAMKGFGTDEGTLIRVFAHMPPEQLPVLKSTYQQRHHRSLEDDIKKECSGYFELALVSILRGPLAQDVWCLNRALKGAGTKESLLDDVLVGRSNADMRAIKTAYQQTYHRSLESDVRADLSAKTERLYSMILAANRQEDSTPVYPQQVDADVTELHRATEAKAGTEQLTVCSILSSRSDGQIRAIAQAYESKYRITLEKVILKEFSGHMEDALIRMVRTGADKAMRDSVDLEECMKGPGTKDEMLVWRLVRIHWDRAHVGQVKGAYRVKYGKDLVQRVRGEVSGDYERMMVAMLE
ncbi:MAG: hypothetical protein Q9167_007288 [Letrouitia subvulpina]